MPVGVAAQAVEPLHRSVVGHDFADHAGRIEARQPREIDRGLGLARAHEHAAFARAQRKRVSRPQEVGRARFGIEQPFDRGGAIVRRDAGRRHAARFDRDGERGLVDGRVVAHHLRDVQFVEPRARHRHADQSAGVLAHEVDRLGRDHLGRHDEIALVLAVLVVEHDDHLAGANVGDRLVDGVERAVAGIGELFAESRKDVRQALERAVRRLAPAGAQQRDRRLGESGALGHLGGGQAGPFDGGVQGGGEATHPSSVAVS